MANDNKPLIFGPSAAFDPATHEPRSGKSASMNEMVTDILRVNAELKYIEHLLHAFDTADETITIAQVRQDFRDKFKTSGPLLNQYFGLLRFFPLMMIKEKNKKLKEQSEDAIRIKIIRDSIAHSDFSIDETGYTFTDGKSTTKVTFNEHHEFLHRIENEFYAKHN